MADRADATAPVLDAALDAAPDVAADSGSGALDPDAAGSAQGSGSDAIDEGSASAGSDEIEMDPNTAEDLDPEKGSAAAAEDEAADAPESGSAAEAKAPEPPPTVKRATRASRWLGSTAIPRCPRWIQRAAPARKEKRLSSTGVISNR